MPVLPFRQHSHRVELINQDALALGVISQRCQVNPPLWGDENSHQPVKGLCIAPRARISLYVTCLEPPWALLPLEPRVRPLVGHFGLASIGTERTPHRSAYIIG